MTARGGLVRLQIPSLFDMVDLVQVLSDRMGQMAAFDEDAIHWVGVAVRESVINAIKHGNQNDLAKMVHVEFTASTDPDAGGLTVSVRDEGEGFEPEEVADPLAPENMLKSSGRGIFLIRNFMDEIELRRPPEGGMEVKMIKKLAKAAL
jgi:serine/threonine-protein kinase RsbW